jgi:SAM-dependent methyltransferase
MPLLSACAQRRKINYFLKSIPRDSCILEVGSGSGWVGEYFRSNGYTGYRGLNLFGSADIVGDIREWPKLGLKAESFDVIIAFEVVEHVNCFKECYELLKPGGRLMLTSPVPRLDWMMKILEYVRLNQRRTSPHAYLVDFSTVPYFEKKHIKIVGWLSQWGVFTKQPG